MIILYYSRDYTTHDWNFLQKYSESSHEVYFLRLEDDGIPYETRQLPKRIHNIVWKGGRKPAKGLEDWISLIPDFEKVIKRIEPDLIHAGPITSCGFMAALTRFHPLVAMSWGSDILTDPGRGPIWEWIIRYTLKSSDYLLCDCRAVRDQVGEIMDYSDERIIEFPWGTDINKFYPGVDLLCIRKRLGWEKNFIILSTRAWEPLYGTNVLIEAFEKSYSRDKNLRLIMLMTGSLMGKIGKFIESKRLSEVIFLPGIISQDDIANYYRAADLYVSCSFNDGTSISLLEAMATGLPVVVSDILGNREWVISDENGWLVRTGDVQGFSEIFILAASKRKSELASFGVKNREVIRNRANWNTNFKILLSFYEKMKNRQHPESL